MSIAGGQMTTNAAATGTDVGLIMSATRPNVLVEGTDADVARFFVAIASDLRGPVITWDGGAPPARGTLVVRHADQLTDAEQRRLERSIADQRLGLQIVSTCAPRLFALVQRGAFREGLYYRLNTVRIVI